MPISLIWRCLNVILKKGLWLESNHGVKWKIIDMNDGKITIRKYYKDINVGTITGITLEDIKKYFKI